MKETDDVLEGNLLNYELKPINRSIYEIYRNLLKKGIYSNRRNSEREKYKDTGLT